MDRFEEIISTIPKQFRNSEVKYNHEVMSFSDFIKSVLLPANSEVEINQLCEKIKARYLPLLLPDDKYAYISKYIETRKQEGTFIPVVNGIDVEEYLTTICYDGMDENHEVTIQGVTKSLDNWYQTITKKPTVEIEDGVEVELDDEQVRSYVEDYIRHNLDNRLEREILVSMVNRKYNLSCYMLDTILHNYDSSMRINIDGKIRSISDYIKLEHDKQLMIIDSRIQICQNILSTIDPVVSESILEGMGKSVREYIISNIPLLMYSDTELVVDGTSYNLQDYINRIVIEQKNYLSSIEDTINRVGETPNNVGLINPFDTGEVIVPLNDDEVMDLSKRSLDGSFLEYTPEEEYRAMLNNLRGAIRNSRTMNDLEAKLTQLKDIESRASMLNLSSYINELINACHEQYNAKKNNLVKSNANSDELVGCIEDSVHVLKTMIKRAGTKEDLNEVEFEMRKIEEKFLDGSVRDFSLRNELDLLREMLKARITALSMADYKRNIENERAYNNFEYDQILIRNTYRTLEYETEPKYVAAQQIRLQKLVNKFLENLESALKGGVITQAQYDEFNLSLERSVGKEENKKGKVA